jgi:hypothetical protein
MSVDSEVELVAEGKGAGKRRAVEMGDQKTVEARKTVAKQGTSSPAAAQPPAKKKWTGIERLEVLATKEEETTQKMLDLKKVKAQGVTERALAKIKASAEIKIQRERMRAELTAKKLDHEFQLRMAQINHVPPAQPYFGASTSTISAGNSMHGTSSSGWSGAGSATPSMYSGDFDFDDSSSLYSSLNLSDGTVQLPPDSTTDGS